MAAVWHDWQTLPLFRSSIRCKGCVPGMKKSFRVVGATPVAVGVSVGVAVDVGEGVAVGVFEGVNVGVAVPVAVGLGDGVSFPGWRRRGFGGRRGRRRARGAGGGGGRGSIGRKLRVGQPEDRPVVGRKIEFALLILAKRDEGVAGVQFGNRRLPVAAAETVLQTRPE